MAKYQGHKNRTCWNVALYLFNDEGLYNLVRRKVKQTDNLDEAAGNILSCLYEMGIKETPDGYKYSKSAIRAALVGCKDTFR